MAEEGREGVSRDGEAGGENEGCEVHGCGVVLKCCEVCCIVEFDVSFER